MSTEPSTMSSAPQAARFERASDLPFWNLYRLGVIIWCSCILIRHASYWGGVVVGVGGFGGGTEEVRAACFAGMEAIVLSLLLIAASCSNRLGPIRRTLNVLAGLGGFYLAIASISLGFDLQYGPHSPIHVIWMAASRLQIWVIPLLTIVAAAWHHDA